MGVVWSIVMATKDHLLGMQHPQIHYQYMWYVINMLASSNPSRVHAMQLSLCV